MDTRQKPREGRRQAGTDRTGTRARATSEDQPFYMQILLAIPKNLVYIFAGIIVFAFFAMMYITWQDEDISTYMQYDRSKEVIVVHPLYEQLRRDINLDKFKIDTRSAGQLSLQQFNMDFVTSNRPVVIKDMAKEWGAIEHWKDMEEMGALVGDGFTTINRMGRMSLNDPFTQYKMRSQKTPSRYINAFKQIQSSWEQASLNGTVIYYIEDEPFRGLRSDYSYPMLQKFLRLQRTSWSWFPQMLTRRPLQVAGENFQCVINGKEVYRTISPLFKQNLYTDVFEDLSSGSMPDEISFFDKIPRQYPLLEEVKDYIIEGELGPGDCIYLPDRWWYQSKTVENSTIMNFEYEQHSKLVDLFFSAIDYGVLDKD